MATSTTASQIKANGGLSVGSGGSTLAKILKGTVSVVISALAAAGEEDITLTITGAATGDVVVLTPLDASMETGVSVAAAWVSAANTVKVRVSNLHTSGLTGSTAAWKYVIIQ